MSSFGATTVEMPGKQLAGGELVAEEGAKLSVIDISEPTTRTLKNYATQSSNNNTHATHSSTYAHRAKPSCAEMCRLTPS